MILEVFTVLIVVFLIMIYLGYKAETPLFSLIGYFFIFLLSFTLIQNNLEYKVGFTETVMNNVTTTTTFNYTAYANTKNYGYYLAVGSAVMMILTIIQATSIGDKINERFYEQ